MSKENPLSHHEQLRYDYLLRAFITSMSERKKSLLTYKVKLNMASGSEVSQKFIMKITIWKKSFMESINQSPLPSYGNRSRAKNTRKVILFQRLSPKTARFVGGAFCRIACSSSLSVLE